MAAVIVLGTALAGCSGGSTKVIRDQVEADRVFGEVAELTKDALMKNVTSQPLNAQDLANLEKAKPMIKGLIAFDPTKYRIYVVNAQTLLALGERDAAQENFEQALLNAPDPAQASSEDRFIMAECHSDLSNIAYSNNQLSVSEDEIRAALRLVPPHKDSPASQKYLLNLTQIQLAQQRFDEAKKTLAEVRAIWPTSEGAKELGAMLEDESGKQK